MTSAFHLPARRAGGAAIALLVLAATLAGCQKTSTTTETPGGTSTTTTTYSVPAMPALSASASAMAHSAMSGASQALAKAEEKIDDGALTAKVKAALLTAADVKAARIDVDSRDGLVTLNGTQESAAAIARAAEVARGTAGVVTVENKLTMQSP